MLITTKKLLVCNASVTEHVCLLHYSNRTQHWLLISLSVRWIDFIFSWNSVGVTRHICHISWWTWHRFHMEFMFSSRFVRGRYSPTKPCYCYICDAINVIYCIQLVTLALLLKYHDYLCVQKSPWCFYDVFLKFSTHLAHQICYNIFAFVNLT